jgi:hypothetical protein
MPDDVKLMPTGNVQIGNALRAIVVPELDRLSKEIAALRKEVAALKEATKQKVK